MTTPVEVNDEVHGDDTRSGRRVYFQYTIEVPLGALTVTAKNHQRPASSSTVR